MLYRASIPYMVVGSFASMAHGIPRTTQDLDIVIDPSAASLDPSLREIDAITSRSTGTSRETP